MKVGNFVQFTIDVQDLLSHFAAVKTTDQMVSALEKIKRTSASDFLEIVASLQGSFDSLMTDDIETPSADEIESLFTASSENQESDEPQNTSPAERLGIDVGGGG